MHERTKAALIASASHQPAEETQETQEDASTRINPRGLVLRVWKNSKLRAYLSNAVYRSRDKRNRINRRNSKQSPRGDVVVGGNYN